MSPGRRTLWLWLLVALVAVVGVLVFFLAPWGGSSSPDHLQKVAKDKGFENKAVGTAEKSGLSKGVSAVIGVAAVVVLLVGSALTVRFVRTKRGDGEEGAPREA